jgi:PIN domain nuclease of toxin-antitoxin system
VVTARNEVHASTASLWEIAIKTGLGKLDPGLPLEKVADFLERAGFFVLDVNRHHAVAQVEPEPATRDPFDRMLLSQCKIEGLQLVTLDRALLDHPLAWRQPA